MLQELDMVKSLERGQKFLVPLPDGAFAPGYIVLDGNLFTLVNIFRNLQSSRTEPMDFPDEQILFRDWLIGDHVFSRSKRIIEFPWVLFRTKFVPEPAHPQIEGIIFGERGHEKVKGFKTGQIIRDPATQEDLLSLPRHGIKEAGYYSLCVQAKFEGKEVKLDPNTREYVFV